MTVTVPQAVPSLPGFVKLMLPRELLVYRGGGRTKIGEERRCRLCDRDRDLRPLTRHHLVPKSWFNRRRFLLYEPGFGYSHVHRNLIRDADANIVPLCAPCHRAVEGDDQARKMLRPRLAAQEATFAIRMRGEEWFDRVYPTGWPRSI